MGCQDRVIASSIWMTASFLSIVLACDLDYGAKIRAMQEPRIRGSSCQRRTCEAGGGPNQSLSRLSSQGSRSRGHSTFILSVMWADSAQAPLEVVSYRVPPVVQHEYLCELTGVQCDTNAFLS